MTQGTFKWQVYFADGTPMREVTARTEEGAKRTALYAERVTGNKTRKLRVAKAVKLYAVGWQVQPGLFEAQAVADAQAQAEGEQS